jgi:hypothetical protein
MQRCSYIVMKTNNSEGNSKHKTKLILVSNLWTCSLVPICIHIYFFLLSNFESQLSFHRNYIFIPWIELTLWRALLSTIILNQCKLESQYLLNIDMCSQPSPPPPPPPFAPFTSPINQSPSQLSFTTFRFTMKRVT